MVKQSGSCFSGKISFNFDLEGDQFLKELLVTVQRGFNFWGQPVTIQ